MALSSALKDRRYDKFAIGPTGLPCVRLVIEAEASDLSGEALSDLEMDQYLENSNGETALRAFNLED